MTLDETLNKLESILGLDDTLTLYHNYFYPLYNKKHNKEKDIAKYLLLCLSKEYREQAEKTFIRYVNLIGGKEWKRYENLKQGQQET